MRTKKFYPFCDEQVEEGDSLNSSHLLRQPWVKLGVLAIYKDNKERKVFDLPSQMFKQHPI